MAKENFYLQKVNEVLPTPWNLDIRFRIMDKYGEVRQVLTLAPPPVEEVVGPEEASELPKIANDEIAEFIVKYPD